MSYTVDVPACDLLGGGGISCQVCVGAAAVVIGGAAVVVGVAVATLLITDDFHWLAEIGQ